MNSIDRASGHPRLARFVERFAHPLILAGALAAWWQASRGELATLPILLATLVLCATLERLIPASPHWRLTPAARGRLIAVYTLGFIVSVSLIAAYTSLLMPALAGVRERFGAVVWPRGWPVIAQALLLYFASDLVYYWIHRAIHRSAFLWRVTGHGFHHGFQNLHAINAGASHPFEFVLIVLPLVLLAAATGAPAQAVSCAGMLLLVNSTLAHANLRMHTPGFSALFTSSNQHRRHHSAVFEESNTNYACNAIVWDRMFGTHSRGAVQQTGIGPTQPALWQMFMLPLREPADADTVASRRRAG